jgi:hypothetical protein
MTAIKPERIGSLGWRIRLMVGIDEKSLVQVQGIYHAGAAD